MSVTTVTVLGSGLATVQDLGRPGFSKVGVAGNGAGDRYAASVAAVLVGGEPGDPVIEILGGGIALRVDRDALVAVTGAACEVLVDGHSRPAWQTLVVPAGSRIVLEPPEFGSRSYLAVGGRWDVPRMLGSVAPDPLIAPMPLLTAGATVTIHTPFDGLDHPFSRVPLFRFAVPRPTLSGEYTIDVVPGPEGHEFEDDPLSGDFTVTPQSDNVGLRMSGPAPVRRRGGETLSRGVPVGAVEVAGGALLVLLRGRLVTAGYPVVAIATSVAVDLLAQARPDDLVRWRTVTAADGVAAARRQAEVVRTVATAVRGALAASGLS